MPPPSGCRSACLLDNKLLHQGVQCIEVVCQGGPRLCLDLQRAHLRRVFTDNGVVALKVVVLGLQQQPQTWGLPGAASCTQQSGCLKAGMLGLK